MDNYMITYAYSEDLSWELYETVSAVNEIMALEVFEELCPCDSDDIKIINIELVEDEDFDDIDD